MVSGVLIILLSSLGHTQGAVTSARAARKKRWICFFITIVLLIVIALAVGIPIAQQASKNNTNRT